MYIYAGGYVVSLSCEVVELMMLFYTSSDIKKATLSVSSLDKSINYPGINPRVFQENKKRSQRIDSNFSPEDILEDLTSISELEDEHMEQLLREVKEEKQEYELSIPQPKTPKSPTAMAPLLTPPTIQEILQTSEVPSSGSKKQEEQVRQELFKDPNIGLNESTQLNATVPEKEPILNTLLTPIQEDSSNSSTPFEIDDPAILQMGVSSIMIPMGTEETERPSSPRPPVIPVTEKNHVLLTTPRAREEQPTSSIPTPTTTPVPTPTAMENTEGPSLPPPVVPAIPIPPPVMMPPTASLPPLPPPLPLPSVSTKPIASTPQDNNKNESVNGHIYNEEEVLKALNAPSTNTEPAPRRDANPNKSGAKHKKSQPAAPKTNACPIHKEEVDMDQLMNCFIDTESLTTEAKEVPSKNSICFYGLYDPV